MTDSTDKLIADLTVIDQLVAELASGSPNAEESLREAMARIEAAAAGVTHRKLRHYLLRRRYTQALEILTEGSGPAD